MTVIGHDAGAAVLQEIGLTAADEDVYLALLEHPRGSVPEIARTTGRGVNSVRSAVDRLEELGFASRVVGGDGRWMAARPDSAVDALVQRRKDELATAQRQARDLAERYPDQLRARPDELVSIVTGKPAVEAQFVQLMNEIGTELLVLDRPPYAQQAAATNTSEIDLLARGAAVRGIYAPEAFEIAGAFDQALASVDAGEQARVHGQVPMKLAVGDRRVALLPLTGTGMVDSALTVRAPTVVGALVQLFELLWQQATPLSGWAPGTATTAGSPLDEQLLTLLATGMKDESIARELGISVRTLGRRMAALMTALGARTRFQAGAGAAAMAGHERR